MCCDDGSFSWDGDWVFDFGVAMNPDPDAPATLRQVAEMMLDVFISARDKGVEARASDAFHEGVECLQEIAAAPAAAKAGDDYIGTGDTIDIRKQSQMRHPELWAKATLTRASDITDPSPLIPETHVMMHSNNLPKPGPSPDPFAPMVEAALDAWHSAGSNEWRMRRALAAERAKVAKLHEALVELLDAVDTHDKANGKRMVDKHATENARAVSAEMMGDVT